MSAAANRLGNRERLEPGRIEDRSEPGPRAAIAVGARDRRIQLVLMLLEENSHNQLEIAEIARIVNLSPGRLAHLFKSETGVAVQQYLTQIRLAKAKHQLEQTFLSIKEIAASAGFPSVTSFSSAFKTFVGTTPAQYRKVAGRIYANRKSLVIAKSANK